MSSRRDERQQHESYLWRALPLALCIVFLADPSGAFGQTQAGESPQAASSAPVRAPSVPGTPLKSAGDKDIPSTIAPRLGESTDEVLAAVLGYDNLRLSELRKRSII